MPHVRDVALAPLASQSCRLWTLASLSRFYEEDEHTMPSPQILGDAPSLTARSATPSAVDECSKAAALILYADLAVARRVEAAWDRLGVENVLAQQGRARELGAEFLAIGGGHAVFLGSGSPLSQAQGLGMSGPVRDEELAQLNQFFKDRGSPTQIEVASPADASLLPALSLRGYAIVEQTHNLILPLASWPARRAGAPGSTASSGSVIEVVRTEEAELEEWVDLLLRCFFEGSNQPPDTLREGALAMGMVPTVTTWKALVDGRPAGGGSLMIHDGVAMICGDGTLPEFRRRGVHAALLSARLAHATEAGCDLAAICTQPCSGSQRNAERQGFHVAYARTMLVHH
jgi:hypothetical protein